MSSYLNIKVAWILGAAAFVISLIYQTPASLLSQMVAYQSGQRFLLTQTQGTVWRGNTHVAIATSSTQEAIGTLKWQIILSHLLKGELNIELTWNQSPPALLKLTPKQISVSQLATELPASAITAFIPSLNAAELGGQLHVNSEHFSVSKEALQGTLTVVWGQVSSPLSPINPLGQYQLLLSGAGQTLTIQLLTQNGALQLAGSGDWSTQSGLNFRGTASTPDANKETLSPLLHIIGNEEVLGSGAYAFNVSI